MCHNIVIILYYDMKQDCILEFECTMPPFVHVHVHVQNEFGSIPQCTYMYRVHSVHIRVQIQIILHSATA